MDRQESDRSSEIESRSEGEHKVDEIRSEMAGTCASLAGKIEALQEKVIGTVEQTVESVQETVETVQETVKESVQAAKRTFNLRYQTEQHPFRMVGLAMAAGFCAGYLTAPPRRETAGRRGLRQPARNNGDSWPQGDGKSLQGTALPAASEPSGGILDAFADELRQLKGIAIGAGMAMLRDWLRQSAPGLGQNIDQLLNSVSSKLGGTVTEGPVLARSTQPSAHPDGRPHAWSAAG